MINWSYIAGLVDGEGCLFIGKYQNGHPTTKCMGYRLDIHITTTSKELSEYLLKELGGVVFFNKRQRPNHKDSYRWTTKKNFDKEAFLLGVLPYLIIKRKIAEVCLEYLWLDNKIVPEKRESLLIRARVLTKRGSDVPIAA